MPGGDGQGELFEAAAPAQPDMTDELRDQVSAGSSSSSSAGLRAAETVQTDREARGRVVSSSEARADLGIAKDPETTTDAVFAVDKMAEEAARLRAEAARQERAALEAKQRPINERGRDQLAKHWKRPPTRGEEAIAESTLAARDRERREHPPEWTPGTIDAPTDPRDAAEPATETTQE